MNVDVAHLYPEITFVLVGERLVVGILELSLEFCPEGLDALLLPAVVARGAREAPADTRLFSALGHAFLIDLLSYPHALSLHQAIVVDISFPVSFLT